MLKPQLQTIPTEAVAVQTTADRRMTGRRLQERRLRIWKQDPHCAGCRALVAYPHGFQLDHKTPLHQGGADTEANCQVLCHGCHDAKTARDLRG